MADIEALEESYYSQYGTYFQILPSNGLPTYEQGTVASNLGENVPDDVRVDVYQSPAGAGYQITFDQDGSEYSSGEGPEASARAYTVALSSNAASSTPSAASSQTASTTAETMTATSSAETSEATTSSEASSTIDLLISSSTPDIQSSTAGATTSDEDEGVGATTSTPSATASSTDE